jgi:hypothetical protein
MRSLPLFVLIPSLLIACGEIEDPSSADPDAGPSESVDGQVTSEVDTTITGAPPSLDNRADITISFEANLSGASFNCSLDDGDAVDCTSPHGLTVGEGEHTFSVFASSEGIQDPTPATHTWTTDLTPPDTTIVAAPAALDNSVTVDVEFSVDETGATTSCSLDGGPQTPCQSPHHITGLTDGSHELIITATDAAGNVEVEPAVHTWTIDTASPDTLIDSGPFGIVSDATASFSFSSPDAGAGATFACSVDGAGFGPCASPVPLTSLSEGSHEFRVRVTDATGNVDPTPAIRTWTVDTVAPTVSISAGPTGPTNDNTPQFAFTVGGSPTLVECRVDSQPYAACTSPFTTVSLSDGAHDFDVRVTDAAGNRGADARAFLVDTIAPSATITSGPDGLTNDATPSWSFTVSGDPTVVQCRVDSGAFVSCSSPFTSASLSDGNHELDVRVRDAAGNQGGTSRSVTVDTVAPPISITAGPSGFVSDSTPTFSFASESGASFSCRIDAGAYASCTSSHTTPFLSQGSHQFRVRARDAAGNYSSSAARSFTVDTISPSVTILSGPGSGEHLFTRQVRFTFSVTDTNLVATECRIWVLGNSVPSYTSCQSPMEYPVSGFDTDWRFQVRGRDAVGRSSSRTRTFTISVPAG